MHAISIHCNYKQSYMRKCENGKKIYEKSFVSTVCLQTLSLSV